MPPSSVAGSGILCSIIVLYVSCPPPSSNPACLAGPLQAVGSSSHVEPDWAPLHQWAQDGCTFPSTDGGWIMARESVLSSGRRTSESSATQTQQLTWNIYILYNIQHINMDLVQLFEEQWPKENIILVRVSDQQMHLMHTHTACCMHILTHALFWLILIYLFNIYFLKYRKCIYSTKYFTYQIQCTCHAVPFPACEKKYTQAFVSQEGAVKGQGNCPLSYLKGYLTNYMCAHDCFNSFDHKGTCQFVCACQPAQYNTVLGIFIKVQRCTCSSIT